MAAIYIIFSFLEIRETIMKQKKQLHFWRE